MKISRLWLSLLPLAAAVLLVPAGVATAAPAAAVPTLSVALDPITVAPAQREKTAFLLGTLSHREQPARSHRLSYTVDFTGAAELVEMEFESFPLLIVTEDEEWSPCKRAGTVLTCSVSGVRPIGGGLFSMGDFLVTPTATATVGAVGSVTVTARLDDQDPVTSTTPVRIAERVSLAAGNAGLTSSAAPGEVGSFTPRVRNAGPNAIEGTVLQLGTSVDIVVTNASNCWFDVVVSCVFDTVLEPGRVYGLSAPIQWRAPADAAGGSIAESSVQWLTMAEFEDRQRWVEGLSRRGTGAELTLAPLGAASGVPQVDPTPASEYAGLQLAIRGKRPNLTVVAAPLYITPGGRRSFKVSVLNQGPGALHPDLFGNNYTMAEIKLPRGVKLVRASTCLTLGDFDGVDLLCPSGWTKHAGAARVTHTVLLRATSTFTGGVATVSLSDEYNELELPAARKDNAVRVRFRRG
ncbi:hypothetical protein [Symbioplanes lichenis]|uniref:hypothetical protein n=1 Tax=Symbioplanes lichenis TaxID=1629072 RepID=UPI002739D0D8|nr:hypothetical protein [Actinoplanes lichenis]